MCTLALVLFVHDGIEGHGWINTWSNLDFSLVALDDPKAPFQKVCTWLAISSHSLI